MPTYEVLVVDEMLPYLTNDNPALPSGLTVHAPSERCAPPSWTWVRVTDTNAPAWTDGNCIGFTITTEHDAHGDVLRSWITEYQPVAEHAARHLGACAP